VRVKEKKPFFDMNGGAFYNGTLPHKPCQSIFDLTLALSLSMPPRPLSQMYSVYRGLGLKNSKIEYSGVTFHHVRKSIYLSRGGRKTLAGSKVTPLVNSNLPDSPILKIKLWQVTIQ